MTITVTIQKLGTTAIADVDLLGLDQTKLQLVASDKTNELSASEYVLADGSLLYDVRVFVRAQFDPRANGGYGNMRYMWKIAGRKTIEDSVLLTLLNYPVDASIIVNWPGKGIDDVTEARQLINNLFALTFPSVAAGVISDAFITDLAYGITQLY